MTQLRHQLGQTPGIATVLAAVAGVLAICVSACVPPPSARAYDPMTASAVEVEAAVAQMEQVAATQHWRLENDRLWSGAASLLSGLVLEVLILSNDPCEISLFGENECAFRQSMFLGLAGGSIGAGIALLAIPTSNERQTRVLAETSAETESERRHKLEHLYRYFDGVDTIDNAQLHQMGAALLMGLGIALFSIPQAYDEPDMSEESFMIAGGVSGALGIAWLTLALTLLEDPVYDFTIAPLPVQGGVQVGWSSSF